MRKLFRLPFRRRAEPPLAKAARALADQAPEAVQASLRTLGRLRPAQVAPALLVATGAGAAFWWWTQWARGRAESEGEEKKD